MRTLFKEGEQAMSEATLIGVLRHDEGVARELRMIPVPRARGRST